MSNKVAVFRKESFNAAHRLFNPGWDQATNDRVHNYDLVVKVVGVPDPATGYVMDMKILSDLVQREIVERFDHRNLNLDTVEFRNLNPTAENIAVVIYNLLRPHIGPELELQVRLYETPRNFVEYPA